MARFLNDGASVAIFDLNAENAENLLQTDFQSSAEKGQIKFYHVNVADRQACFEAAEKVVKDFGKINFLFNGVANFRCSVSKKYQHWVQ